MKFNSGKSFVRPAFFLLFPVWFSLALNAQPPAVEEPPPTRELAICFLFASELPELYYRDAEGEPQPLKIERERFTTWNNIPLAPELNLYKKNLNEEGLEVFLPAATWQLPPGNSPVRKLFYLTAHGQPASFYLEAADASHGSMQIRAINLTDEAVILSLNDITVTLKAKQEQTFAKSSEANVRFLFQYGAKDSKGQTRVSPVSNLRFRNERQRMTLIFGYQPEVDDSAGKREILGYRVNAMRLYDTVPDTP